MSAAITYRSGIRKQKRMVRKRDKIMVKKWYQNIQVVLLFQLQQPPRGATLHGQTLFL